MIQAILAGRKTQTRRIVKSDKEFAPGAKIQWGFTAFTPDRHISVRGKHANGDFGESFIKLKYGKKGDVLWARETFADGYNGLLDDNLGKPEKEWTTRYWVFKDGSQIYSDGTYFKDTKTGKEDSFKNVKWKPSIHMPKVAARIWQENIGVRVERLQCISEADAIAEGILSYYDEVLKSTRYKDYMTDATEYGHPDHDYPTLSSPIESYKTLWQSINGIDSWDANPFVWVITTKQINKP